MSVFSDQEKNKLGALMRALIETYKMQKPRKHAVSGVFAYSV